MTLMNESLTLPLITLQPIADSGNLWVGVRLTGRPPVDGAALAYILLECGLAASLQTVRCEVVADPATIDGALLAALPAGRVTLHLPDDAGSQALPVQSAAAG